MNEALVVPAGGMRLAAAQLVVVDDAGLLVDPQQGGVYGVDPLTAFIWLCLEDNLPPLQIHRRLVATFGLDELQAARHLYDRLDNLRDHGLLDAATVVPCAHADTGLAPPVEGEEVAVWPLRLLDCNFRVGLHLHLHPAEVHAAMGALVTAHLAPEAQPIAVYTAGGSFVVASGDHILATCARSDRLLPALQQALADIALGASADFGVLRAAAVAGAHGTILLPGAEGSGRTTLTAALAARGLPPLTDEHAVLAAGTLGLRPLPFGLATGTTVWDQFDAAFPTLADQLVHARADDALIRYLPILTPTGQDTQIAEICFPCRGPGPARRQSLSPDQALMHLLPHFRPLGGPLDAAGVRVLRDWLTGIPAALLHYAEAREAAALL